MKFFRYAALATAFLLPAAAQALEIKISSAALERTLQKQLFTGDNGRYYIRGNDKSACYVFAEDPKVSFKDDRVVIHVKTHAKLGTGLRGACLGVGLNTEADVSVIPNAEGETIGFRDARIEHLSESKELNFFLVPFLSGKLPQQMKVNAADLLRQLLASSTQTMGYDLKLDSMKIHSMQVQGDMLIVDFDGGLSVH
ncbi:MAG TPA: hypothetical protein VGN16_09865 [Acidobacteriaceae bacterium]|jgi:hypothetical protein